MTKHETADSLIEELSIYGIHGEAYLCNYLDGNGIDIVIDNNTDVEVSEDGRIVQVTWASPKVVLHPPTAAPYTVQQAVDWIVGMLKLSWDGASREAVANLRLTEEETA